MGCLPYKEQMGVWDERKMGGARGKAGETGISMQKKPQVQVKKKIESN